MTNNLGFKEYPHCIECGAVMNKWYGVCHNCLIKRVDDD